MYIYSTAMYIYRIFVSPRKWRPEVHKYAYVDIISDWWHNVILFVQFVIFIVYNVFVGYKNYFHFLYNNLHRHKPEHFNWAILHKQFLLQPFLQLSLQLFVLPQIIPGIF